MANDFPNAKTREVADEMTHRERWSHKITVGLETYAYQAILSAADVLGETQSDVLRRALLGYLRAPLGRTISYPRGRARLALGGDASWARRIEFEYPITDKTPARGPHPKFIHRVSFALSDDMQQLMLQRAVDEHVGYATLVRRAIDFFISEQMASSEDATAPHGSDLDATRTTAAPAEVLHEAGLETGAYSIPSASSKP